MTDRFTRAEMAEELGKLCMSKMSWLNTFAGEKHPRPQWEIEIRRKELRVLEQARDAYRAAAERGKA